MARWRFPFKINKQNDSVLYALLPADSLTAHL
jgi:hypothetical protein